MKIQNTPDLSGCIVLERGTSFLAKQIIAHNRLIARIERRPFLPYSHAEFLLWSRSDKQLYTIGARAKGTEITKVQDYYTKCHDLMILRPTVWKYSHPLRAWSYYHKIKDSKYQPFALLAWITYIKTLGLVWLTMRGDQRNYCYELAARFANAAGLWPQDKPLDRVSLFDLVSNPYYVEKS